MKQLSTTVLAIATLASAVSAVAVPAAAETTILTARAADLVPVPSRVLHGVVSIRNVGSAASAPSVATLICDKVGGGGCAEAPGMAAYENAMYPGAVVVMIPALAPGAIHNHTLAFWSDLDWQSGSYNFVLQADAGAAVPETNEGNNFGGTTLVVP
jgi:hypothetical protein